MAGKSFLSFALIFSVEIELLVPKSKQYSFWCFLKDDGKNVDEIEFRGNERDHGKTAFKISAISYNVIVIEEKN